MSDQIAPLPPISLGRLPAIGTPGAPSVDVITIQGAGSGQPIPVTGTITASMSALVPGSAIIGKVQIDQSGTSTIAVAQPRSTVSEMSLSEQMASLVAAQYATVTLLSQLVALERGRTDPLPGEEGEALIGEYLDGRNRFTTLAN